jgi:LacI family transcriptional regulator
MTSRERQGPQRVTIRDVAALAGVSVMTVSRVINDAPNVAQAKRDAVRQAIGTLNFVPNAHARGLRREVVRVGLLYGNPSTAFLSEFLLGALEESAATGDQLVLERCGASAASERAALQRLIDGGASGVLLHAPLCDAKSVLDLVRQTGLPAVAVGPGTPLPDIATVWMDNHKAARDLTTHLLSLGHRRIAFIKGHPNQSVSAMRWLGFQSALAEFGVDPASVPVAQGFFSYQSGLACAETLLTAAQRPTAIFAANDDMAAATLAVAHRMGLDVPGSLSVAGFDDTPMASTVWPRLTTVHQPIVAMARAGVRLLRDRVRQARDGAPAEVPQVQVKHALARRESTGPVAAG